MAYDRRVANRNQQTQKKGKSTDSKGIRAEDIKACDDETREMVRQLFNEIIKRVKIRVIHKKGDEENMSNYRPICSLLALYKLFSTILYGRFFPMLDQKQAEDQAGFGKTYQTTDHLATYRLIEQKYHEWESKCGQRRSTSRRHSTPSLTNLFGRHSNLATSITSTSAS